MQTNQNTLVNTARIAGGLYLLLILFGIYSLLYVPSQIIEWDNATQTAANIRENELLFRSGIVLGLLAYLVFLFLPLQLHQLLSSVHKRAAILMVVLAVISVPVSLLNYGHQFAALSLARGTGYLSNLTHANLDPMVLMHLEQYYDGNLIAQLFWGLWLFPLGYLVFRSGFLPKILGLILMVGSVGYTLDFFGRALYSEYGATAIAAFITIPASIGEIGICLWLIFMGARVHKSTDH
jgi:hypothetical protein